jgi:hypothetical protein
MNSGYIYIRVHDSYEKYNVCKLGKTLNLMERNSTYKTSEVECGFFELVIEVQKQKLDIIERLLQNHFKSLQYYYYLDGGTEFFKKAIIPLIVPYLKTLNSKTNAKFEPSSALGYKAQWLFFFIFLNRSWVDWPKK